MATLSQTRNAPIRLFDISNLWCINEVFTISGLERF